LAVRDRFDIVRERLPPDLGEVVTGAMARAGYRPAREAPNSAGPYRRPADEPLSASFEPDPAARPRRIGQVQVRQEDGRTLRVEIAFPPARFRWRSFASLAWMFGWITMAALVRRWVDWPHWVEQGLMMMPAIVGAQWVRSRMGTIPPSQVYRVILDAIADALDDANGVRIEAAVSEVADLPAADDHVETEGGEDDATHAGRHQR